MLSINGARLTTAVLESNMTGKEICARAGVPHQTLKKMLDGQIVRFPAVARICKELGITASEILTETVDKSPPPDIGLRQLRSARGCIPRLFESTKGRGGFRRRTGRGGELSDRD